jgi:glycogen debranching enzyme
MELRIGAVTPLLLASNLTADGSLLSVDLANSDVYGIGDQEPVVRETVHVVRQLFIWNNTLHQRFKIRSYHKAPLFLVLQLVFDADFADIFEVRGSQRAASGQRLPAELAPDAVTLKYEGRDEIARSTTLRFCPAPHALAASSAVYNLELSPDSECVVHALVEARQALDDADELEPQDLRDNYRRLRREGVEVERERPRLSSNSERFDGWLNRSVSDLHMLLSETRHGLYPHAGTPWFNTVFGRDGIITAMLALAFEPEIAAGVLRHLAATQATKEDAFRDAAPGKILHESRRSEMARTGEVPFATYYGSVDSTPLFVMLASQYWERTGDTKLIRTIWPNVRSALDWIDHYGDIDGDGFVEYQRECDTGLRNQGWKDSETAISHADGSLATGAIALCEVQGYVYAARQGASVLAGILDEPELADRLHTQATALGARINDAFWDPDLGTYALALDGDKKPCRVVASNAGHLLLTDLVDEDRAARLVDTLSRAAMYSGWGVRTLSAAELRYSPLSYHNGSVWPHDTALVALGMARHGYRDTAARLLTGLFEASLHMRLNRLPELFCGFAKKRGRSPVNYADACSPQAWSSAACYGLLTAALGLSVDGCHQQVRVEGPVLPRVLQRLNIAGLCVEDAQLDLGFERVAGGETRVVPSGFGGDIELVVTR